MSVVRRPASALLLVLLTLVGAYQTATASEAEPTREYRVKAAFIYNIARYVDWPLTGLGGEHAALCVIGQDRFGSALEAVEGRFVHGRTLRTRVVSDLAEIPDCDILFVDRSEEFRLIEICTVAQENAVLTVSDSPGFAERCVMVNLVQRGKRLGLEVNRKAVAQARLRLSSELLRLADIVRSDSGEEGD